MTTITRFTKEQLIAKAQEQIEFIRRTQVTGAGREHVDMCGALFEIALASLTAEPVYQYQSGIYNEDSGETEWYWDDCDQGFYSQYAEDRRRIVYAAPPAPVVPDEYVRDEHGRMMLNGKCEPKIGFGAGWNACRAAMLQGAEPVTMAYRLPEETGSLLQLRNLIRKRHAEWSQATFGDVGPVGPLKHLSKEALEAAAEPEDLSEFADMQFLLWDAQRRAGISDAEITAAMENKLKINMERQWPEPKDGEPRLHIKEPGNSPVIPDEVLSAIRKVARIRADFDDFDGDRRGIGDCLDEAEQELIVTINKHASVIAAAPQQEAE